MNDEIKNYLKSHLGLRWEVNRHGDYFLDLTLDNETISKVPFHMD